MTDCGESKCMGGMQCRQWFLTTWSSTNMPICLNCPNYNWQPAKVASPDGPFYHSQESLAPLLRCSKCRVAHYCDKDCQLEHWKKVHKERCQLYSGETPQVAGVHRHQASKCQACKEENQLGGAIAKKYDPHWGCHLQGNKQFWDNPTNTFRDREGKLGTSPLAMELGELTSNFTSNVEHVVSLLQKILHKMKLTAHALSTWPQFKQLDQQLFHLRHELLMFAANLPPGELVDHAHGVFAFNSGKLEEIKTMKKAIRKQYVDNNNDTFRLWDTFVLIFDYFLDMTKPAKKDLEDLGLKIKDKKMKSLMAQVEPTVKVEEKWQLVVKAFTPSLAPYNDLLKIILGGLRQPCSICKARVTIESTSEDHPPGSEREKRPVAMCHGNLIKFHCGRKKCRADLQKKYEQDVDAVETTVFQKGKSQRGNRCDWCREVKRKVHRCSRCFTKVYCSQECLNKDWSMVHKDICRQLPNARKIKMDQKNAVKEEEKYL